MSCLQIADECTGYKFRLNYKHPADFCIPRYTCFLARKSYLIYRVFFAILFIVLLGLDYLWIIALNGVSDQNRLSACLDASQWSLIFLCLCYILLVYLASQWSKSGEEFIRYKFVWFLYTCSLNAVYATMIIFWMSEINISNLEPILKHSIPGCLILVDLFLNSIPFYLCHAVYPALVYLTYLAIVTLGIYLAYLTGTADRNQTGPSSPTVWIGGHPLLPNGYQDFDNIPRILFMVLGSITMAVMIHCVLLTLIILRDFLASLCGQSTEEDDSTLNCTNPKYLISQESSTSNLDESQLQISEKSIENEKPQKQ